MAAMAVACEEQFGLRAALFSGDQDFGDGCRLGEGKLAVHLAHEVAAQWNEEENAETTAGKADEDGLHRARIEAQDVQRRKCKDRASHHSG